MSVIRLRDVSKRFDGRQVLRQVFFRLEDGARVGLVGNNGTGKTTVLRLILGREHPSEARVEVDDGLRIGYFSQFSELSGAVCIEDVLRDLFAHIETTESQLPAHRGGAVRRTGGRGARTATQGLRSTDGRDGGRGRLDLSAPHRHGLEHTGVQRALPSAPRRSALGWLVQPGGAGEDSARSAQRPAAGRADQLPGSPGAVVAGGMAGPVQRGRHPRVARSGLRGQSSHPGRGDRKLSLSGVRGGIRRVHPEETRADQTAGATVPLS